MLQATRANKAAVVQRIARMGETPLEWERKRGDLPAVSVGPVAPVVENLPVGERLTNPSRQRGVGKGAGVRSRGKARPLSFTNASVKVIARGTRNFLVSPDYAAVSLDIGREMTKMAVVLRSAMQAGAVAHQPLLVDSHFWSMQ